MQLTDEQAQAVQLATSPEAPPLVCLTGGPGTGKTTTLRELLRAAGDRGLRTKCAAPSGKAAQRMEEATGRSASTLHRLMGLLPGSSDWSAIEADLVVIDEASMVDVELMAAVREATRAGRVRTVLLVGDADQLPPVGPGQPFHDLLEGGVCPTVRLTQVHRQALDSGIVRAAHAIRQGDVPELDAPDCRLVECEDLALIPSACWEVIRREGLDATSSQVLVPQRNTAGGAQEINRFVEKARRPVDESEPLVRGVYRAGTKVINSKNDYEQNVFNGELGFVTKAVVGRDERGKEKVGKDELEVEIAGGLKRYRGPAIRALQPAWAMTVHKSQGSQWDDVVVVAHRAFTKMLTRRLLYVAVTRAARRVWIVGTAGAVAKAVRNTSDAKRRTWLSQRFARDLKREQSAAAAAGVE